MVKVVLKNTELVRARAGLSHLAPSVDPAPQAPSGKVEALGNHL